MKWCAIIALWSFLPCLSVLGSLPAQKDPEMTEVISTNDKISPNVERRLKGYLVWIDTDLHVQNGKVTKVIVNRIKIYKDKQEVTLDPITVRSVRDEYSAAFMRWRLKPDATGVLGFVFSHYYQG